MIEIAGGILLAVAILVTLPIWLPLLVVGVGLLVALVAVVLAVWGLVYIAQTEPSAFVLIGPILAWLIWYGYEAWRLRRNETNRRVERDAERQAQSGGPIKSGDLPSSASPDAGSPPLPELDRRSPGAQVQDPSRPEGPSSGERRGADGAVLTEVIGS